MCIRDRLSGDQYPGAVAPGSGEGPRRARAVSRRSLDRPMGPSTGMPCRELVELVTACLDGALLAGERARCDEHLRTCAGCRAYRAQMEALVGGLGELHREQEEDRAEACVLLGHDAANARVRAGLERRGLAPDAFHRLNRLHTVSGQQPADAVLRDLGDRIRTAVADGVPMVRILGHLGWERPGWPAAVSYTH